MTVNWYFLDFGLGAHGTSPWLARIFEDEVELGERVTEFLDAETIGDWP